MRKLQVLTDGELSTVVGGATAATLVARLRTLLKVTAVTAVGVTAIAVTRVTAAITGILR